MTIAKDERYGIFEEHFFSDDRLPRRRQYRDDEDVLRTYASKPEAEAAAAKANTPSGVAYPLSHGEYSHPDYQVYLLSDAKKLYVRDN